MSLHSSYLYTRDGTRALDQTAIETFKIPGTTLMARAGQAVFCHVLEHFPQAKKILVLAGPGNNGGDAYIVARLLKEHRLEPVLYFFNAPVTEDAKHARNACEKSGAIIAPWTTECEIKNFDLIIDGLLGTGVKPLAGEFLAAVTKVNASKIPVVAIDVPTGLDADTGQSLGEVVVAHSTVTFIGKKQGLYTGMAKSVCGKVTFNNLEVPQEVYQSVPHSAQAVSFADCRQELPPRLGNSHKGDFGHVLIIGGELGMMGAPLMSGQAALRVGAGLVSVATRPEHASFLSMARPELMVHGVETPADLEPLIKKATVIAIGPGLGQSDWGKALFEAVLPLTQPKVLDADALNWLSKAPEQSNDWILTPHPAEAARLLQSQTSEIQKDRFKSLQTLQQQYGGCVVLKGAGTLIGAPNQKPLVCLDGNPGMSSAGMGDVLTGVIVGLLAQKMSLAQAAKIGVCLHSHAGDKAAMAGERGLIATDLLPELRYAINEHHLLLS